jgi:hypothetical protein
VVNGEALAVHESDREGVRVMEAQDGIRSVIRF